MSDAADQMAAAVVPAAESAPARRLRLTAASDITMRPVRWLWDGRIPAGMVTLIAGRPGIGKSLTLVWLTAQITRGALPGVCKGSPRAVIYAATEDSWEHTIVPRLVAAGADLTRVFRVDAMEQDAVTSLTISADHRELSKLIAEQDAGMLALDPMMSTLGGGVDAHRNNEVRSALLEPLASLADTSGCTVVGLAHFRKATAGAEPLSLITGSSAFGEVIRAALVVARDPDADDGSCVISPAKNNLGEDRPSLRYKIAAATVETPEGDTGVGLLRMLGETDRDVRDILADQADPIAPAEQRDAAEWLVGYLTDHNGEAPANQVLKAARSDGIAERTLQRARARARVSSVRRGYGQGAVWTLDPSTTDSDDGGRHSRHSRHSRLGNVLGANGANGANEGANPPTNVTDSNSGAVSTCRFCGSTSPVDGPAVHTTACQLHPAGGTLDTLTTTEGQDR
ncbi:MAG TPA: AAA family ATPase [Mycobacteriales bacterium]|nr:AAA family ATPase [Mycobacteriales bacterium]